MTRESQKQKSAFLGCGGLRKGYRFYDQRSSCVFYSRDIFNKSVRGIKTEQEESLLIQVENYTEEDDLVTQFRDHNAGTEEPAEHNTHTMLTHRHTLTHKPTHITVTQAPMHTLSLMQVMMIKKE